jgi:monoamine oxidase
MHPTHPAVAIIGGGLSGLAAALLLEQQGLRDVVLFEARDGLGGRIASMDADGALVDCGTPGLDRFDLGPTWFWPDYQAQLDRLVQDLGLRCFEQFGQGDMLVERAPGQAALRRPAFASAPASMRLAGGTGSLIAALYGRLDARRVLLGHTVRRLRHAHTHVELEVQQASGQTRNWRATQVLLALPPRLAASRLAFEPALPPELARGWRATPTWMAPHAKYLAVYDSPFWRDQGLSGDAQSAQGPMVEIHDVSMPGGHAALFGFVGVPARVRQGVAQQVLMAHCRAQLGRLFGKQAAHPRAERLKDWAADPLTATDEDQAAAAAQHAEAPPSRPAGGPWSDCLTGIGSEWSQLFPGYLAGALDAATRGVLSILAPTP